MFFSFLFIKCIHLQLVKILSFSMCVCLLVLTCAWVGVKCVCKFACILYTSLYVYVEVVDCGFPVLFVHYNLTFVRHLMLLLL